MAVRGGPPCIVHTIQGGRNGKINGCNLFRLNCRARFKAVDFFLFWPSCVDRVVYGCVQGVPLKKFQITKKKHSNCE